MLARVTTRFMAGPLLHCPVRGPLKASMLAKDGLQFTEEKRRIECIRFLLAKGYPAANMKVETVVLRFGHKGRNSLRTDLAVFDVPVATLPADVEEQSQHIRLVAEIKRDNADAKQAKQTQVKPAMDFLPDLSVFGLYWDDVEQRLFYKVVTGTKTKTHETAAAVLPAWGQKLGAARLTSADLRATNLRVVFERINDTLHTDIADLSARFEIMLQLLLAKLYDEHTHTAKKPMSLQDFSDSPLPDAAVKTEFDKLLGQAVSFYGKYLPKPVPKTIAAKGALLRAVSAILAPVRIFGAKRAVIQDFYMYFAQGVYKWDLAQYFTPTEVVDFIVALVNPQPGDQVKDPACGSGDFLIATLHHAQQSGGDMSDAIWGADNSEQAVQVCVLNMVLNGDGKSNITHEDSLVEMPKHDDVYSVLLCNPPFGVRIVEKRFDVLRHFDLGHEWKADPKTGVMQRTNKVCKKEETGILFAELCVRQAEAGGRIGLIMPNGYLGNRGPRYLALREWLLRNTRLVAVVGFPRFTFKKSGADVSASVLVLERLDKPLASAKDADDYPFHAGLLESVGWSAGDKRAEPVYQRDPATGEMLLDSNNEPMLDADFERALQEFRSSPAAQTVAWALHGISSPSSTKAGHFVDIREVLDRPDLSLDPKRWCKRCTQVRESVARGPHFRIGDVVDMIVEDRPKNDPKQIYGYVEISNISDGQGIPEEMRGWQLPDRAKQGATPGDIFVGGIWSSVDKWFVASGDCTNLRVTNGCRRMRLKKQHKTLLLDLVAGLNTETYRIQARAFCTGSDGLADLSAENLGEIVLPKVTDAAARAALKPYVDALLAGRATVASAVAGLVADGKLAKTPVKPRSNHMVQV